MFKLFCRFNVYTCYSRTLLITSLKNTHLTCRRSLDAPVNIARHSGRCSAAAEHCERESFVSLQFTCLYECLGPAANIPQHLAPTLLLPSLLLSFSLFAINLIDAGYNFVVEYLHNLNLKRRTFLWATSRRRKGIIYC